MLWSGFINGGSSAFAALHDAMLHSAAIVPTQVLCWLNGLRCGAYTNLGMKLRSGDVVLA
jgi:hypothetical protein